MKIKIIFILSLIVLTTSLVLAIPGIPHQFYGTVTVNGEPAPDNNILVASIEGDSYATVTQDGRYGFAPNIFYVEDPEGNRAGDVTFYLGGKEVGTSVFANNGFTNLDISTTTTCGDGYCLGDETCTSCQNDCGICTDPPIITIVSPENKVYDTTKIDLIITSDQNIILWLYNLNNIGFVTFTPNIILTVQEGENNVIVEGRNENGQYGSRSIAFTVELPVETCSDGIQNQGETGVDCGGPCAACPSSGGSSGGGGGGSGGSSRGSIVTTSTSGDSGEGEFETLSSDEDETLEETSVGGGMTGGVIGTLGTGGIVVLAVILIIIIIGLIIIASRKKK